jgi:hypothetical protein
VSRSLASECLGEIAGGSAERHGAGDRRSAAAHGSQGQPGLVGRQDSADHGPVTGIHVVALNQHSQDQPGGNSCASSDSWGSGKCSCNPGPTGVITDMVGMRRTIPHPRPTRQSNDQTRCGPFTSRADFVRNYPRSVQLSEPPRFFELTSLSCLAGPEPA